MFFITTLYSLFGGYQLYIVQHFMILELTDEIFLLVFKIVYFVMLRKTLLFEIEHDEHNVALLTPRP